MRGAPKAVHQGQDKRSVDTVHGVQEHTARAFWHLAVADSEEVFEAVMESAILAALLRLAAPEVTKGAQLARQALRRLCEDPDVGLSP